MKQYKVIAIIVTYNRDDLLKNLLKSVYEQSYQFYKVILIDNNNSQILIEFSNDNLIYHKTNNNIGSSGGFAKGIELALGFNPDCVMLLDDDIYLKQNTLENLLNYYDESSLLQCVRLDKNGNLVELTCQYFNLKNPFINNPRQKIIKDIYKNYEDLLDKLKINDITFEGVLIPTKIIREVGNIKSDFFIFCDDTEFSLRAIKKGANCYLIKKAVVVKQLSIPVKVTDWKEYFLNRNMYYIYHNYGENLFVKVKPFFHSLGKTLKLLLLFEIKRIKRVYFAFYDFIKNQFPVRII